MKCYFFGTFNPIHLGHIKIVNEVERELKTSVILVPSYFPPHKDTLSFRDRAEMLKCVFPFDRVLEIEKTIEPPNYSYKTIERLGECYFIIGYDAFLEIESWRNPLYLKKMLHFVVIPRDYKKQDERFEKLREKGYDFRVLDFNLIDISSREIRQKVKNGEDIKSLVPKSVERYINEHRLYKELA